MKKWIVRILAVLLLTVVVVLTSAFVWDEIDKQVIEKYVRNENLPTVKADWKGVPVDRRDRFVNHEHPFLPRTIELLRWQLGERPFKDEKAADKARLEIKDPTAFLQSGRDGIVWLGHASFYIRLNGRGILVDPVFGDPRFIDKFVDVPNPLEKLPRVDFVLVSHDHRDHCDETTLRATARRFPEAAFLAGLRMDDLFNEWKQPTNRVETAGWFQRYSLTGEDLKITFVPVRHWCRRGLLDTNHRLWGGFVIEGAGQTIYFGGDSGYGAHYRETAEAFPEIDYFLIGIGAYEPRWFMEANHNNPADAFRAFADARAKYLVPMHYGTFDLSDEPPSQPLKLIREEARRAGAEDRLKPITIGESLIFDEGN